VRDQHVQALGAVVARDYRPPRYLEGDGIVYCGEGRYWPMIVIAVRLLREAGCYLPVQVWHNGPAGPDLGDVPGVTLVDVRLFQLAHPARVLRGWEAKTYAIAHCGLRRVLYLDADAYAVADVTPLFDLLIRWPFVFWRDLHHCTGNVHWRYFGIPAADGQRIPPVQGGHLLFDLSACWRFLMVAHWLNQHSDYSYGHSFGDQDAWRVALTATGTAWHCLGDALWRRYAFVCEHPAGEPVIVHRCRGKLFPGLPAKTWGGLPAEARVLELFAEVCDGRPAAPGIGRRELALKARGR
jgi:hypothetical protein